MSRYTVRCDYYAVLKIPHSADLATITNTYKRLAPEFQLLSEAYETLRDEDKRRECGSTYLQADHCDGSKHRKQNSTESSVSIPAVIERARRLVALYGQLQRVQDEIETLTHELGKDLLQLSGGPIV
ncbi:DNAj domain protein [Aspergillus pseudoviridinutans]|uniref:DNAj domain protein n=1 Tax=Aspergillus pseudoviridinutans TaxID=1517512 RepID=A0A9P3BND6_9EURO|nr:DNAj domain protein [Aspergillus pseudoviridinutans]GIJ90914.1 DNAj domain protein [Aspergillus pseudoviridinutans]